MDKKLYRLRDQKMIAGVCSGIADYFHVDPTVVRLLFVGILLAAKLGAVVAYIIMAVIMPEKESEGTPTISTNRSRTILGLALVAIGGFMLFERYFRWVDMSILYAVGLVILGAFILLKGSK